MGFRPMVTAKLSLPLAAAAMLCLLAPSTILAQMPAPIDSGQYAAKAIQVTGRVSVLRDSIEYAIVEGGQVNVKELIFTGSDGQARFQVSDGSTFDVYPNSRVIFRKNVPNWRDLLDVLVGRVKVHIEHWGNQPNHNRVLTPTAVISVRGTTFDISVDDDDETTVVEVEEGVVEVQHALLPGGSPRILNTGESLRVYRNEPIASGRIDKGEVFKRVARMAIDAFSTMESRVRVAGGAWDRAVRRAVSAIPSVQVLPAAPARLREFPAWEQLRLRLQVVERSSTAARESTCTASKSRKRDGRRCATSL